MRSTQCLESMRGSDFTAIRGPFLRLATAVVIEQHDEWQVTRRYVSDVSMDELWAVIAAKGHATTQVTAQVLEIS